MKCSWPYVSPIVIAAALHKQGVLNLFRSVSSFSCVPTAQFPPTKNVTDYH